MAELNVNVGDKVLYQYSVGEMVYEMIATVTAVIKDKLICIDKNYRLYDMSGNEAESKNYGSKISTLTDADMERIERKETIKQAYELMQIKAREMTYEQALRVIDIFGDATS